MNKLPSVLICIIIAGLVLSGCSVQTVTIANLNTRPPDTLPPSSIIPTTTYVTVAPSTIPPTTKVTITPVTTQPEEKIDSWQISVSISIISSYDSFSYEDTKKVMEPGGIQAGGIGQGMPYVYENIDKYWAYIKESNTIILYNTWAEALSDLDDCPAEYKEVFPFTAGELATMKPPFAWLKRSDNNLIRAIIVARNKDDLLALLQVMVDRPVPVGTPWTISNGLAVTPDNILPPTTSNSTIKASDFWITTGQLNLLTSKYAEGGALDYLKTAGYHPGTFGGGVSYIYDSLPKYGEIILTSDTIILFWVSFESLTLLNNWPAEYRELCPFNVNDYDKTSTPFAVVKLDSKNKVRALIVVKDEKDIIAFVQALNDKYVPLDIPWTISDGEVVAISN